MEKADAPLCFDRPHHMCVGICVYHNRRIKKATVAGWQAVTTPINLVLGLHLPCQPGESMWSSMLLLTFPPLIYLPSLKTSCWHLICAPSISISDFSNLCHSHCHYWYPEPGCIILSYLLWFGANYMYQENILLLNQALLKKGWNHWYLHAHPLTWCCRSWICW